MDKQYLSYAGLMGDDLLKEMMVGDEQYIDNHHRLFNECDSDDLLDKLLYIDLKTSLCEQLLMLTDKMSMYTSLEARVPYLDHRMVEFAARIPGQYKLKGFKLRHVQKRTFRRKLPSFVFRQVKRGFGAPVGNWVRSDLKGMMLDYLSPGKLKAQGLFNTEVVNKIVRAHLDTQADFTDILLGMIAFQIWWRQNNF
jgi:asparagine synthase (glutamine-hydrolysing)